MQSRCLFCLILPCFDVFLCNLYMFVPDSNLFFVMIVDYTFFGNLELQFSTACAKVSSRSAGVIPLEDIL